MLDGNQRILCISSYEKGQDFMRQCAELGVIPTLLTVEKLRDAPWPREILEDVSYMPYTYTVDELVKTGVLDVPRTVFRSGDCAG